MKKIIILRYSEIYLKRTNRGYFERTLVTNIERSLKGLKHELHRESGRYIVDGFDDEACDEITERLKHVFGVHSISVASQVPTSLDNIYEAALPICNDNGSFKVACHRADKKYEYNSVEIAAEIGGRLISAYPNLTVDLKNPSFTISVDVRENGTTLVFNEVIPGADGIPVGTSGKGLLLISGGIDSPVAGHMVAKRGLSVDCIHFHSYPYTNLQAKQKVIDLAGVLATYIPKMTLYIVSVTEIQEAIHKNCNPDYMVTILRRFMMRISEKIAKQNNANCIITGESLGQVASQTVEGMTSTEAVLQHLLVLRPLCGLDKDEIIARAKAMGTFDISIQPYEDCCTVFLPRHPVIHPSILDVMKEEEKLDINTLVNNAIRTLEVMKF